MTDPVLAAQGRDVRAAAATLRTAPTQAKDAALVAGAHALLERADAVLKANAEDVASATKAGLAPSALDRLRLDPDRIAAMADGLEAVARLADPVGEVVDGWVRPNGLRVERVRVPLGVVGVIYENRPNVTADAAGLCLKRGTRRSCAGRPPPRPRTSRSSPRSARGWRPPDSRGPPSAWSRTPAARPWSPSCSSTASSTA